MKMPWYLYNRCHVRISNGSLELVTSAAEQASEYFNFNYTKLQLVKCESAITESAILAQNPIAM
jgi:hypothetical protein